MVRPSSELEPGDSFEPGRSKTEKPRVAPIHTRRKPSLIFTTDFRDAGDFRVLPPAHHTNGESESEGDLEVMTEALSYQAFCGQ